MSTTREDGTEAEGRALSSNTPVVARNRSNARLRLAFVVVCFVILHDLRLSSQISWAFDDSSSSIQNLDSPSLITQDESNKPSPRRNTTNPSSGKTTRFFPRWDSETISFASLQAYMNHAGEHLQQGRTLLRCANGLCPTDMPEVLYIFGGPSSFPQAGLSWSDSTSSSSSTKRRQRVWVEGRRRKLVGVGFKKRYPIVEELMEEALKYLLGITETDSKSSLSFKNLTFENLRPPQELFPTLHKYIASAQAQSILQNLENLSNDTLLNLSIPLGIPMVANLGDNRQCHKDNLVVNGVNYSVPVFTLAVPVDCGHAYPIPHPAVLDTAQAYGHDWSRVHAHRQSNYPFSNQTSQAIWRGSPTGPKYGVRYRMVLAANIPPSANLSNLFDVGFGKPLHKIHSSPTPKGFPSHQSIQDRWIKGRSKVWFEDFGQYRIILDADGSSWSERTAPLLCLNSLVAKLEPSFVDWLWPHWKKDEHFVSVARDSSNLWQVVSKHLSILRDEVQHGTIPKGESSRKITQNANEWCARHLTYEQMILDFLMSLEDYVQRLEKGDPDWHLKWNQYLIQQMIPQHHHWNGLPVQKTKPYFPTMDLSSLNAN